MTTVMRHPVERPPRRGSFVGPLILIVIGAVLLMNTFGVVQWNLWTAFFTLWPLFLVAAGLDLLIGRRSLAGGLLVALITVAMFAAGMWYLSSDRFQGASLDGQSISQEVGRADRAEVRLTGGVSELRVGAADNSDTLITGEVELARSEEIVESLTMRGNTAIYQLDTKMEGGFNSFPFWGGGNQNVWSLQLNGELPMELAVTMGVGPATLDLAELDLTDFTLQAGVGPADVTLPRNGTYTAQIEAGVGSLAVRIPEGLAARVTVDSGLGAVNVDGDFDHVGDSWTSPGWNQASDRVTLHISAGVGSVNVSAAR